MSDTARAALAYLGVIVGLVVMVFILLASDNPHRRGRDQ